MLGGVTGVVMNRRATQAVAGGVMVERCLVLAAVLERLAERKLEVRALGVSQSVADQCGAYRVDLVLGKAEGLQVREAPVGLTGTGLKRYGATVGRDAVCFPPGTGERMPVAHPDRRLRGMTAQDLVVDPDRLGVIPDLRQDDGAQIAVRPVARLDGEQPLDFLHGLRRLVLTVEHERVVVTGGIKAWREFETALEEMLGVPVPPQPAGDLGEHAQCGDVVRVARKMLAQQSFRAGQVIAAQRGRGRQKARIARRRAHLLRVGGGRSVGIAVERQVVGDRAPGIDEIRLQRHGTPPGGERRLTLLRVGQCLPVFKMRRRPAGVLRHDLREAVRCLGCAPEEARGDSANEACHALPRRDTQDLTRLLRGQRRIRVEQPDRVIKRGFNRAAGRRCVAVHGRTTALMGRARLRPRTTRSADPGPP